MPCACHDAMPIRPHAQRKARRKSALQSSYQPQIQLFQNLGWVRCKFGQRAHRADNQRHRHRSPQSLPAHISQQDQCRPLELVLKRNDLEEVTPNLLRRPVRARHREPRQMKAASPGSAPAAVRARS